MDAAVNAYLIGLIAGLWGLGVLILLNSLDELFVDLCFLLTVRKRHLVPKQIGKTSEIHILVPVWQEQGVIGPMLHYCRTHLLLPNVTIWVGCYANDALTEAEARRAADGYSAIHITRIKRFGPTTKADCLNQLWQSLPTLPGDAVILLQDAEDMPDPRAVSDLPAWRGTADMLQYPVLPLRKPGDIWTAGHYLDEFAEKHMKELPARWAIGAPLPSAGVGCAFTAGALRRLADETAGNPFDADALTEDYAIALRLARMGSEQRFAAQPPNRLPHLTGTRSLFPNRPAAAIRQKTRWLLGITLQGYTLFGWGRDWRERYFLWRDRKGIGVSFVAFFAYLFSLAFLAGWVAGPLNGAELNVHLAGHPALLGLLSLNAGLLVYRTLIRCLFVGRIYGWREALLAAPRQIWANIINFCAAVRALALYRNHRREAQPLAWDKTDHEFPDQQAKAAE